PESSAKVPWLKLLPHRQTWAFVAAKFTADPIWWFYLFWLAKYLDKTYQVTLGKLAAPLVVIYIVSDVGSICGGWLSSSLIKRGWSVNSARKTAMLICGLCVIPVIFAWRSSNMWVAVGFIGLATAAHQAWSANVFTLASDMFPRRAVGSVVGLGGMGGAVGGILLATLTGAVLQRTGSYQPIFILAGTIYLVALLIVHLLSPRLEPAELE
ncbi:MAG TPA: MFS transporter, partial [Acidobacteriota bacterium]|nr:MFS transporter [Acidobacteriota bacterium]